MLVFHDVRMDERLAALRARGLAPDTELPRGLPREQNGLLWSPEGTALLLLTREP
jgi:hypothetical protein